MRIVYVAGFFQPVLDKLRADAADLLEERAVIWIPQFSQGALDFRRLKSDLFQAAQRGANEILICLFVFRGDREESTLLTLDGIIDEAKSRSPGLKVSIQRWKNARDSDWVLSKIKEFSPTVEISLPTDLQRLEEWILERHGDRVSLHPRAMQAVKKSQYGNVPLIFAAVDLLGTEYWEMRTASQEERAERQRLYAAKLAELGLECTWSISRSRAGQEDHEYFVEYPLGSNKKRMLDLHLKKGSDRETRYCLRIYFFWDEDSRRIVIGSLPGHLATRAT